MLRHLEPLLRWERLHTHPGPRSGTGSKEIRRSGLRCCEPSVFRCNAWVCEFQSNQDGVKACVVRPSGFGGAATPSVVLEAVSVETAASLRTLSTFHPGGAAFRSSTL